MTRRRQNIIFFFLWDWRVRLINKSPFYCTHFFTSGNVCISLSLSILLMKKYVIWLRWLNHTKISKHSIEELEVWLCLLLNPCLPGSINWTAIRGTLLWRAACRSCHISTSYGNTLTDLLSAGGKCSSKQTAEGHLWPSKWVLTWRIVLQSTDLIHHHTVEG